MMHACKPYEFRKVTRILNSRLDRLLSMSSINHDEIRHRILRILYEFEQENPTRGGMTRDEVKKILQIPEKQMDFNIHYLDQKGLVELHLSGSKYWYSVRITAFGIDVITDKEKFSDQFPFMNVPIQEIHGDVYGTVVQAVESQVSINQ